MSLTEICKNYEREHNSELPERELTIMAKFDAETIENRMGENRNER